MVLRARNEYGIAEWRRASRVERLLARLADESEFWRRRYVGYYKRLDRRYYDKGLEMARRQIDTFRSRADEEERHRLIIDMVYSLHRFGCGFDEYFLFGFEGLNTSGREGFITDKGRWSFYEQMNGGVNLPLFIEKYNAYRDYSKFYGRRMVLVGGEEDEASALSLMEGNAKLFLKPKDSCIGRGCRVIDVPNGREDRLALLDSIASGGGGILEELIVQAPAMASLHPQSVNTVRAQMMLSGDGIDLTGSTLRMGRGGSCVDNGGAGGIFAPIDVEAGIVTGRGRDERGRYYVRHPDTGVVIPGFQIPKWDMLVSLVGELARIRPEIRFVGWDLALTDEGWLVVEGNDNAQFLSQYANSANGGILQHYRDACSGLDA